MPASPSPRMRPDQAAGYVLVAHLRTGGDLASNRSTSLYIRQDLYPRQFAADVPLSQSALMAVTQRPATLAALADPSGAAAWRAIPSWFVFGSADRNIPPALHRFMARRAKARRTVEVRGASHVVGISHPGRSPT